MERVYIFDTTLRDGGQTKGVDFSFADKIAISEALDDLGIDYIEGGWPGANPTDDKLFGSVTTQMISDSLQEKGFKVDKKYISVEDTIKSLGNYSAIVDFGDDISAKVKLKVVAE